MAKTKSAARLPTSLLADVDQQMEKLAQRIKDRFAQVKREAGNLQQEMETLSQHHERLTGKGLLNGLNGSRAARPGPKPGPRAASGAKGNRGGKRTRKPSPSVEWLQEQVSKRGMTVKQLQRAAEADNLSGIRIPALLKENKAKFKAEAGTKEEGVKGKAAMVWGIK